MDTLSLPSDLKAWAEAQVAAGRATSVEALATQALLDAKRQQDAIAAKLNDARTEADRDGWIDGDVALAELRSWIDEDDAEASGAP